MSDQEQARQHPGDLPPGAAAADRPRQQWTLDGYPIVDGKYHDLGTDEIKIHTGALRGGPPSVSVYWNNRAGITRPDQFVAVGSTSGQTVTAYIVRVGDMLREGSCSVHSLNATEYAVNVIVSTALSTEEFMGVLRRHGLLG